MASGPLITITDRVGSSTFVWFSQPAVLDLAAFAHVHTFAGFQALHPPVCSTKLPDLSLAGASAVALTFALALALSFLCSLASRQPSWGICTFLHSPPLPLAASLFPYDNLPHLLALDFTLPACPLSAGSPAGAPVLALTLYSCP